MRVKTLDELTALDPRTVAALEAMAVTPWVSQLQPAGVLRCSSRARPIHGARWCSCSAAGAFRYWCDDHLPYWCIELLAVAS